MKLTFTNPFSLVRTPKDDDDFILHVVAIYERNGMKSIDFGGYAVSDGSIILRDDYKDLKSAQQDVINLSDIDNILSSLSRKRPIR